jgi:mannose-6-phosphate isomerase
MHNDIERVLKPWGYEIIYFNGNYCLKKLIIRPFHQTSLHAHTKKDETFLVVHGAIIYRWVSESGTHDIFMGEGDSVRVKPGTIHRLMAMGDEAEVVESSTHHDDADTTRYEPGGPWLPPELSIASYLRRIPR